MSSLIPVGEWTGAMNSRSSCTFKPLVMKSSGMLAMRLPSDINASKRFTAEGPRSIIN